MSNLPSGTSFRHMSDSQHRWCQNVSATLFCHCRKVSIAKFGDFLEMCSEIFSYRYFAGKRIWSIFWTTREPSSSGCKYRTTVSPSLGSRRLFTKESKFSNRSVYPCKGQCHRVRFGNTFLITLVIFGILPNTHG